MIPAVNAMDAHVHGLVALDDLLLPSLQAFAHFTRSLHAIRNACFQFVCSKRTVCRSPLARTMDNRPHPPPTRTTQETNTTSQESSLCLHLQY